MKEIIPNRGYIDADGIKYNIIVNMQYKKQIYIFDSKNIDIIEIQISEFYLIKL